MLLLGHVGIALGAVQLAAPACATLLRQRTGAVYRLIDYRFLALGAVLPDLIDKPLGLLILRDALGTSRSIGHTLAFTAALLVIGLLSSRSNRRLALLSLGIGGLSHLILDGMWGTPRTLFWPALGWGFPVGEHQGLANYLFVLWRSPWEHFWLFLSEVLGGFVIGHLFFKLWRRRRLKYFLRKGTLSVTPGIPRDES